MFPRTDDDAGSISACGWDSTSAQHRRLIAHLEGGRHCTRAELERACDVPSVTKRLSELRARGWPIERRIGRTLSANGAQRRATFYRLTGPRLQRDLFTDT